MKAKWTPKGERTDLGSAVGITAMLTSDCGNRTKNMAREFIAGLEAKFMMASGRMTELRVSAE
jgi:hypothetical protein